MAKFLAKNEYFEALARMAFGKAEQAVQKLKRQALEARLARMEEERKLKEEEERKKRKKGAKKKKKMKKKKTMKKAGWAALKASVSSEKEKRSSMTCSR